MHSLEYDPFVAMSQNHDGLLVALTESGRCFIQDPQDYFWREVPGPDGLYVSDKPIARMIKIVKDREAP